MSHSDKKGWEKRNEPIEKPQELIGILQAISIVAKSLAAKLMQIEKEVEAYEAAKAASYSSMACEEGYLPIARKIKKRK